MEENRAILEDEISSKLLVTFLQASCRKEEGEEENGGKVKESESERKKSADSADLSAMLQHRFPRAHWEKAVTYFSQNPSQMGT